MSGRKFTFIVNPNSGRRRGELIYKSVQSVFQRAGFEGDMHLTRYSGHAAELARDLDLNSSSGLIVIGGDGAIHEVVSGLMQRTEPDSVPVGVIPAGTGNAFHQHLNVLDPIAAAHKILNQNVSPLDVIRIQQRGQTFYSVNVIGWGTVTDINQLAEKLRILGPTRYSVAALIFIMKARKRRIRLRMDGEWIEEDFYFVLVCNTKFTGKGMQVAPGADHGDGVLDVILIRKATRWQMLKLFARIFDGSHLGMEIVEFRKVREFCIHQESNDVLTIDGELKAGVPFEAEVLPGALRVFG